MDLVTDGLRLILSDDDLHTLVHAKKLKIVLSSNNSTDLFSIYRIPYCFP